MAYDSKGTLNKVMLIGRLGSDPELKYTASGAAVLTINVATNTSYKSQDGNQTDLTEWNRVVIWRKLAEIIAQYAKKGNRVYVEGRLQTRAWDDKDGNKRYTTEIVADSMQMLESRASGGATESSQPPTPSDVDYSQPTADEGDDLPF